MPDRPVTRVADVYTTVVASLSLDRHVTELTMENRVVELLLEQQHVVTAVAVADEQLLVRLHMPLLAAQFAGRRHCHAIPTLEVSRSQHIHPALSIGLQGTGTIGPTGGLALEAKGPHEGKHRQTKGHTDNSATRVRSRWLCG